MKSILLGLFILLGAFLANASTGPCPGPRRPRAWSGFSGPAYLPSRLPRRPKQHVLDSVARATRRPFSITTNRPR